MFGLSFGEIVIIAVLALVLLGPDKLPDALKTAGKHFRDLKKAADDLKDQIETEVYSADRPSPARPGAPTVPLGTPPAPAPVGPPPAASADNVPGLEVALAEPVAPPVSPPSRGPEAPAP